MFCLSSSLHGNRSTISFLFWKVLYNFVSDLDQRCCHRECRWYRIARTYKPVLEPIGNRSHPSYLLRCPVCSAHRIIAHRSSQLTYRNRFSSSQPHYPDLEGTCQCGYHNMTHEDQDIPHYCERCDRRLLMLVKVGQEESQQRQETSYQPDIPPPWKNRIATRPKASKALKVSEAFNPSKPSNPSKPLC